MADDDDTNDDHHHHGFAFPLPASMLAAMADSDDQRRGTSTALENDVYHLLDALTVEQLITLRRVLNCDNTSTSNNYIDGQIVTLLRVVHRVNHVTGVSYEGELLGTTDPA